MHSFVLSLVAELPVGAGAPTCRTCRRWSTPSSAAGSSTPTRSSRAVCRSTSPTATPAQDRDTGPNRPDLIGDPDGPKTRDQWFNAAPIGDPSSAFGRPARGTFGNLPRNALRGPGYWRVDASLFKHFTVRRGPQRRAPAGGRQPVQPRQPGKPGRGGGRAGKQQHQRRADLLHGVRQRRSAAAISSSGEVSILRFVAGTEPVELRSNEEINRFSFLFSPVFLSI